MTLNPACRSCGAPIVWAETASGALMPLDAEPDPNGDWVLFSGGPTPYTRRALPDDVRAGTLRFTTHFATCPDAERWRR